MPNELVIVILSENAGIASYSCFGPAAKVVSILSHCTANPHPIPCFCKGKTYAAFLVANTIKMYVKNEPTM